MSTSTRLCVRCQREKSIRGVWYLTPAHNAFVCESCFSTLSVESIPVA